MAKKRLRKISISWERAREIFDYNPITGIVTWKNPIRKRGPRINPGDRAGTCHSKNGRRTISVEGVSYFESRFIWFWMTGRDPGHLKVDHRDGDPSNGKWDNLRLATSKQNNANKKSCHSSTGYKGVVRLVSPTGLVRYMAQIGYDYRNYYLGKFATPKEAHERYMQEAKKLFGEFYCES